MLIKLKEGVVSKHTVHYIQLHINIQIFRIIIREYQNLNIFYSAGCVVKSTREIMLFE